MHLPSLNLYNVLLSAVPLLLVLYLMIGRNWNGSQAGVAGWLAAILIAVTAFGANGQLLLVAFGRAVLLALFVLYIIWMALLLYHAVNEAGAIKVIGQELPGLASDKPAQALLLGWIFGSFLQGASGFGVPAAVVAPLLLGLGFAANTAVVIALLGHAWAVTFGSLGSSFFSLIAATNLPGEPLAGPSAALLAVCCLLCGMGTLWAAGGRAALRQRWTLLISLTVVMAGAQWLLAIAGFWSLAAFGAGLLGLVVAILDFRWAILDWRTWGNRWLVRINRFSLAANKPQEMLARQSVDYRLLSRALFPYLLLTVVIVLGQTVLKEPLGVVHLNLPFPEVTTRYGWHTPAGPGQAINLFGHPGALLLYASLITFTWYRRQGTLVEGIDYSGRRIWTKTIRGSIPSTISIVTLLAMAVTMQHAGMTQILAETMSAQTGRLFPLLSPFIGALGAFMTGSNTNSNVVFGQLQQQTAVALNLSVAWILAGQTAGGAIGSLFAPAKVIVGCSTVPGANDGQVLRIATAYGLGITLIIGLLVWLLA